MEKDKLKTEQAKDNIVQPIVSSSYICAECGTAHKLTELIIADNGWDYTYSCKKCGDVIESNGKYYGK